MAKLFDLNDYEATSKRLKEYIDREIKKYADEKIIQEDTYLKFPTVGDPHTVYMDTTKKAIYRWDENDLKYYIIVDNYENIDVIDGCGK